MKVDLHPTILCLYNYFTVSSLGRVSVYYKRPKRSELSILFFSTFKLSFLPYVRILCTYVPQGPRPPLPSARACFTGGDADGTLGRIALRSPAKLNSLWRQFLILQIRSGTRVHIVTVVCTSYLTVANSTSPNSQLMHARVIHIERHSR